MTKNSRKDSVFKTSSLFRPIWEAPFTVADPHFTWGLIHYQKYFPWSKDSTIKAWISHLCWKQANKQICLATYLWVILIHECVFMPCIQTVCESHGWAQKSLGHLIAAKSGNTNVLFWLQPAKTLLSFYITVLLTVCVSMSSEGQNSTHSPSAPGSLQRRCAPPLLWSYTH